MKEIAERAVALQGKGFEWMPGMRLRYGGFRVLSSVSNREHAIYGPDGEGDYEVIAADIYRMLPDLTDAATLGCVLALVRKAHNDPNASVYHVDGWWWVSLKGRPVELYPEGATEAEALVAALESASKHLR